jgi:hypothetical protein
MRMFLGDVLMGWKCCVSGYQGENKDNRVRFLSGAHEAVGIEMSGLYLPPLLK